MKRDELAALGYQVIDASNPVVEVAWIVRCPGVSDRVFMAASEDEGWSIAENHHADTPGTLEERMNSCRSTPITAVPDEADKQAAAMFADWHEGFTHNDVDQLAKAMAQHRAEAADEIASLRARVEWLESALVSEREDNLWHAYHSGHVRDGEWDHMCMSDGESLAHECGFNVKDRRIADADIRAAIPEAARQALKDTPDAE